MKAKILYILTGIAIIAGLFLTRITGLDEESKVLIDEAIGINTEEIFPGFEIDKYPQDVNYGKIEYRYYKGQIKEQKAEYPLALSAIPTEEGPVVKVISIKDFRKFYDLGDVSRDELEKAYISVLIHEGFHCYQMERGYAYPITDKGTIDLQGEKMEDFKNNEALLARLDNDKNYQDLWIREMEGLVSYRDTGNNSGYKEAAADKMDYLKAKLSKEEYDSFEKFTYERELIEGSARFVENKVLDHYGLKRNGEFDGTYFKGSSQMYTSGALKSEILENQGKLSQVKFDMSMTLDDLMDI